MNGENLSTLKIVPGCEIVRTGAGEILMGCIDDIVKICANKGIDFPFIIGLPDANYFNGRMQAALEIPCNKFLYVFQGIEKGLKMIVFGTGSQIERMKTILNLILFGATYEQMVGWNIPKDIRDQALKLSLYFRKKHPQTNEPIVLEDFITFMRYDSENKLDLNGVRIQKKDFNVFSFSEGENERIIDLNFDGEQPLPLPLPEPTGLAKRSTLAAIALSKCATGQDPTGYTTAILAVVNGNFIMIDGMTGQKKALSNIGISTNEIGLYVQTHDHSDHGPCYDIMINGQRLPLLTDLLGFQTYSTIAACNLDMSVREAQTMIDFHQIQEGKPFYWFGAEIRCWATAHPIHTLGYRITVYDKETGRNRSITIVGDTVWGEKLDRMLADGIVSASMHTYINDALTGASELTFADLTPFDPVHIPIQEVALLPGQVTSRIAPTHLKAVPLEYAGKFKLIEPGQTWEFIKQEPWNPGDLFQVLNSPILQNLHGRWLQAIISQSKVRDYQKDTVILHYGDSNEFFYVILGGTLDVVNKDKKKIATLAAGGYFGEMSIMNSAPCCASIVTESPSRVLAIPQHLFIQMARKTGLWQELERRNQVRTAFTQFSMVSNLPTEIQNKIYSLAVRKKFLAGQVIMKKDDPADSLVIIESGQALAYDLDENGKTVEIATLYPYQMVGEMGLMNGEGGVRTAHVKALSDMDVFSIDAAQFRQLTEQVPIARYLIGKMVARRLRK